MDSPTLVERDAANGRLLVEALDAAGVPVTVALWAYREVYSEWRLVIVGPLDDAYRSAVVSQAVDDVLRRLRPPLPDWSYRVTIGYPTEPLVTAVRWTYGTDPAPHIGDRSLGLTELGDGYVEAAHIYRAERLFDPNGTLDLWLARPGVSRGRKTAAPARLTFRDGYAVALERDGRPLRVRAGRNGLEVSLHQLVRVHRRGGATIGDVQRLGLIDGRLREVWNEVTEVRVDGYPETPVPTAASA